ncbi:MAG: Glyoxalase family protein, partial [uncultured Thermomicrobiales bacterium]
ASRAACCSRFRATSRALRPMSRWRRWANRWPFHRSWSRAGPRSRPALSRSTRASGSRPASTASPWRRSPH